MTRVACTFCKARAAFGPFAGIAVCAACAKRIADLVLRTRPERLTAIWSTATSPPNATDVDPNATTESAASHATLASAYRDMGLYSDTLREAAIAAHAAADTETTTTALGLLLTPPLLSRGGLAALRKRMTAN